MAAPDSITLENLNGKFFMNKQVSTDPDPILALQGISWVTRTAVSLATITLHISQYKDDEGITHIDIDQVLTGGIPGTSEKRALNWEDREHNDHIFGEVIGKSRWTNLTDVQDEFLKKDWAKESSEGNVIETYVKSVTQGWESSQIWGFQMFDGKRHYARNVLVTKGDERREARFIYEYLE
ncbi:MAG: hypothetical protein M1831_000925 [Alyxoria varia]|nr:MAG: hypothetical protein M1831_000925 [Alyxoria varia]